MGWIFLALGAAIFWGIYGPALHKGQTLLGSPYKGLLCVGAAYFVLGVLAPVLQLAPKGQLGGFTLAGSGYSALGGALGALGAICIIWAFGNGGSPAYVMPIVFGLAPLVNVAVSMFSHPPRQTPNPLLWVGYALASAGVGLVFYFKPAG